MEAARESDYEWHCQRGMLESHGWHFVEIDRRPFDQMQDISRWLEINCRGEYDHHLTAGQFLFERKHDATWFTLAWSAHAG